MYTKNLCFDILKFVMNIYSPLLCISLFGLLCGFTDTRKRKYRRLAALRNEVLVPSLINFELKRKTLAWIPVKLTGVNIGPNNGQLKRLKDRKCRRIEDPYCLETAKPKNICNGTEDLKEPEVPRDCCEDDCTPCEYEIEDTTINEPTDYDGPYSSDFADEPTTTKRPFVYVTDEPTVHTVEEFSIFMPTTEISTEQTFDVFTTELHPTVVIDNVTEYSTIILNTEITTEDLTTESVEEISHVPIPSTQELTTESEKETSDEPITEITKVDQTTESVEEISASAIPSTEELTTESEEETSDEPSTEIITEEVTTEGAPETTEIFDTNTSSVKESTIEDITEDTTTVELSTEFSTIEQTTTRSTILSSSLTTERTIELHHSETTTTTPTTKKTIPAKPIRTTTNPATPIIKLTTHKFTLPPIFTHIIPTYHHPTYHPTHYPTYHPPYDPKYYPTYHPPYDPKYYPTYHPPYDPKHYPTYHPPYDPKYYRTYHPPYDPKYYRTYHPPYDPKYYRTYHPPYDPKYYPTYHPPFDPDYYHTYNPKYYYTYDPNYYHRYPTYQPPYYRNNVVPIPYYTHYPYTVHPSVSSTSRYFYEHRTRKWYNFFTWKYLTFHTTVSPNSHCFDEYDYRNDEREGTTCPTRLPHIETPPYPKRPVDLFFPTCAGTDDCLEIILPTFVPEDETTDKKQEKQKHRKRRTTRRSAPMLPDMKHQQKNKYPGTGVNDAKVLVRIPPSLSELPVVVLKDPQTQMLSLSLVSGDQDQIQPKPALFQPPPNIYQQMIPPPFPYANNLYLSNYPSANKIPYPYMYDPRVIYNKPVYSKENNFLNSLRWIRGTYYKEKNEEGNSTKSKYNIFLNVSYFYVLSILLSIPTIFLN